MTIVDFRCMRYHLLSDRHNDTSGGCGPVCDDMNKKGSGECKTVALYLNDVLMDAKRNNRYLNVFIESPYVLTDTTDPPRADITESDIIEQLQVHLEKAMRRDKTVSPYMPWGRIHYIDIRDVYPDVRYRDDGIRLSLSANPLSGSWSVRRITRSANEGFNDIEDVVSEVTDHIQFIISNAKRVFKSFITSDFNPPERLVDCESAVDYNNRVERMRQMTCLVNRRRVHRTAKQLLKLNTEDRSMITNWAKSRFKQELTEARKKFEDWKRRIAWVVASKDVSLYDSYTKELPVLISVVMGSLVMDCYFLARSFYHNQGNMMFVYTGSAHTDNYVEFFQKNGGVVVEVIRPVMGTERCIVRR